MPVIYPPPRPSYPRASSVVEGGSAVRREQLSLTRPEPLEILESEAARCERLRQGMIDCLEHTARQLRSIQAMLDVGASSAPQSSAFENLSAKPPRSIVT